MRKLLIVSIVVLSLILVLGCAPQAAPTTAPKPAAPTSAAPSPSPTQAPSPKPSTSEAPKPTAAPATHKAVNLKMWGAWPITKFASSPQIQMYEELLNKYGKDVNITAKIVGGPEVFGTYEGIQAILSDTVQVACIAPPYYLGVVPQAMAVMLNNEYTPWESRDKGIFDLMDQYHQKAGLKYLAFTGYPAWFQGYSAFDTPKPDLKGKRIRTAPIYDPLVKALGGTPVNVPAQETYEALKRGMVDGIFWPNMGITDYAWNEVLKFYWGQHSPYLMDCGFIVNMKTWSSLDKDQQAVVNKASLEIERSIATVWQKNSDADFDKLVTKGTMKQIKFSDEDYKFYVKTALDVIWDPLVAKSPDMAKLRELMKKQ